jgi:hypothetical protein
MMFSDNNFQKTVLREREKEERKKERKITYCQGFPMKNYC